MQLVILSGNVSQEPKLGYSKSGTAYCSFGVACNVWKGKERGNEATFWRVTVFGQRAEWANEYLKKGSGVEVIGKNVEASAYAGNDGQPKASLNLIADEVNFASARSGNSNGANENETSHNQANESNGAYEEAHDPTSLL